jgi:hypothetical protein
MSPDPPPDHCPDCPTNAPEGSSYISETGDRYTNQNGNWVHNPVTTPTITVTPNDDSSFSWWDLTKTIAEVAIGFTPLGVVLDVIDLGKAIASGDSTEIGMAIIRGSETLFR